MTTLEDECLHFKQTVIPKEAGPFQNQEMIRSFYAGASSTLKIIYEISKVARGGDQQAADILMQNLRDELDMFCDRVMRGEA